MKFICIRQIEVEEGFYGNVCKDGELSTYVNNGKSIFIVPGEYSVSYNKTDTIVLHNVRIRINNNSNYHMINFIKIDKNVLLDDGYFEGNFIERIFFKNIINDINTKNPDYVSQKEKEETIKEARKIIRNASLKAIENLPVSLRCSVILADLRNHNLNENDDLDETQLKEINRILKIPYKYDKYDYNIFDEIHNIKELNELFEMSNYADFGIYPKYRETCKKCGDMFYLNIHEINWYLNKKLKIPKTCEYCRKGLERPTKIEPKNKISNESLEEEPVKTEMQIALEKAGITITDQN